MFEAVDTCLMFTGVFLCLPWLLVHVYVCLPLFTRVYLCLQLFTRACLPIFTHVYSC